MAKNQSTPKSTLIKEWIKSNPTLISFNPENDFQYILKTYPDMDMVNFKYHYKCYLDVNNTRFCGDLEFIKSLNHNAVVTALLPTVSVIKPTTEIKLFNLATFEVNEKLFIPLKTNKGIDKIISEDIGFMPGTALVIDGGPGTGKTTVAGDCLTSIQTIQPKAKCLYIMSEMNRTDMAAMARKQQNWNNITNILLLSDYDNPLQAINDTLKQGWDFVVMDSFEDIVDKLKDFNGLTSNSAEVTLLKTMSSYCDGAAKDFFTCFFVIQQVTKGGVFKGSNKLKHNTTGFLHLRMNESGERYIFAAKNSRNGGAVMKKMYYSLVKGEIVWNEKRFDADIEAQKKAAEQLELMQSKEFSFDMLLSGNKGIEELVDEEEN